MSTVPASVGSARNSSQLQRWGLSTSPVMEKSHCSRRVWGVGPAESTGKSSVTYWPGGTREGSATGRRRPVKPRLIGDIGDPQLVRSVNPTGASMAASEQSAGPIVTKVSPWPVEDSVARLKEILGARGVKLFAVVDHSGEAE